MYSVLVRQYIILSLFLFLFLSRTVLVTICEYPLEVIY